MRVRDLRPAHQPVVGRRLEEYPGTPARVAEERFEARDPHVRGGYGCNPLHARGVSEHFARIAGRHAALLPPGHRHALVMLGAGALAASAVVFAASPLPRITPDSASYLTGAERLAAEGRFESCAGLITLFAPGYSATLAPARCGRAVRTGRSACRQRARDAGARPRRGLPRSRCPAAGTRRDRRRPRCRSLVRDAPKRRAGLVGAALLRHPGVAPRGDARSGPRPRRPPLGACSRRRRADLGAPADTPLGHLRAPCDRARGLARLGFYLATPGARRRARARTGRRSRPLVGAQHRRRRRSVRASLGVSVSVLDVLEQLPDGLSSVALPTALPLALRLAVAVPLVLAAALAWRRRPDVGGSRAAVAVLTTAAVVYVLAVTASAAQTVVDPIDTRLLSPVLAPVAVLVAIGVSSPRTRLERVLGVFALGVVVVTALLAPGVAWRGHEAERTLRNIPDDISCAEWPSRYSGDAIRLLRDAR